MGAIECPVNGKFVSLILCTCSDPFSCSKLNLCHQFLWIHVHMFTDFARDLIYI